MTRTQTRTRLCMYSNFRKVGPISMTHTVPICFAHKKLRKPPQKVVYLWQLGGVFFYAAQ